MNHVRGYSCRHTLTLSFRRGCGGGEVQQTASAPQVLPKCSPPRQGPNAGPALGESGTDEGNRRANGAAAQC